MTGHSIWPQNQVAASQSLQSIKEKKRKWERAVFNVFSLHKVLWVFKVFRVVKGSLRTLIFISFWRKSGTKTKTVNPGSSDWFILSSSRWQQRPPFRFSCFLSSHFHDLWGCSPRDGVSVAVKGRLQKWPVGHLFFTCSSPCPFCWFWALRFEESENYQAPEHDDGGFGPARPLVASGSLAPQTRLVHPPRLFFLLWAESSEGASIYFELTGSREDALTCFWAILHLCPQNTSCDPSDFLSVVLSMVLTSLAI